MLFNRRKSTIRISDKNTAWTPLNTLTLQHGYQWSASIRTRLQARRFIRCLWWSVGADRPTAEATHIGPNRLFARDFPKYNRWLPHRMAWDCLSAQTGQDIWFQKGLERWPARRNFEKSFLNIITKVFRNFSTIGRTSTESCRSMRLSCDGT